MSQQVNRNAWIYARGAKPLHFNYKTCVHIFSLVPRVPRARARSPPHEALAMVKQGQVVAAVGLRLCCQGSPPGTGCSHGALCRRDLAGGDGGGLCLASRCVLVTQRVLATAEGCDHAVTELGEREAQGEPAGHQAALAAELALSPAVLWCRKNYAYMESPAPLSAAHPIYCQPCLLPSRLLHQPSACITSGGMALHL